MDCPAADHFPQATALLGDYPLGSHEDFICLLSPIPVPVTRICIGTLGFQRILAKLRTVLRTLRRRAPCPFRPANSRNHLRPAIAAKVFLNPCLELDTGSLWGINKTMLSSVLTIAARRIQGGGCWIRELKKELSQTDQIRRPRIACLVRKLKTGFPVVGLCVS